MTHQLKGKRILIVEDERMIAENFIIRNGCRRSRSHRPVGDRDRRARRNCERGFRRRDPRH
jgi:hypothetical protein